MNNNLKLYINFIKHAEEGELLYPEIWKHLPKGEHAPSYKLSKKGAVMRYCDPYASKDALVFLVSGSPADIRKAIKWIEREYDAYPFYVDSHFNPVPVIMREGRNYELHLYDGCWRVFRIKEEV